MMKKGYKLFFAALIIAIIAIQFIPVDRSNPESTAELKDSDPSFAILESKCYDCHSNHTVWPWYSHVAPVSWLVASDVHEGREHLNFSEWENLSTADKLHYAHEIKEMIEKDHMPPGNYTIMHPDSKLSEDDKQVVYDWTKKITSKYSSEYGSEAKAGSEIQEESNHEHEH